MRKLGPFVLGPNDLPEQGIYLGDSRELSKEIPDNSVDMVYTDPPYPKEYLYLFEWLAEESARILKPGGSCLVLSGSLYLDTIWNWFCEHLSYYWILAYYMRGAGGKATLWPRKIWHTWKPILWFVKGERKPKSFVDDGVFSAEADKRFHVWGQPEDWAYYYLSRLTTSEDVVFEPFVGGGTVPAVCKRLGRSYLAFDNDPEAVKSSRRRVIDVQPPTLLPETYQEGLAYGGLE